jgi:hypothetical protein
MCAHRDRIVNLWKIHPDSSKAIFPLERARNTDLAGFVPLAVKANNIPDNVNPFVWRPCPHFTSNLGQHQKVVAPKAHRLQRGPSKGARDRQRQGDLERVTSFTTESDQCFTKVRADARAYGLRKQIQSVRSNKSSIGCIMCGASGVNDPQRDAALIGLSRFKGTRVSTIEQGGLALSQPRRNRGVHRQHEAPLGRCSDPNLSEEF